MDFYNEVIELSGNIGLTNKHNWRLDQRYGGMYPEGARDKEVYFSPKDKSNHFIKSDWRYMFKLPRASWCKWQFWVEVIAYRIGCLMGVPVPPACIGYNTSYFDGINTMKVYGALIEWFYDYKNDIYVPGGQIMSSIVDGYDRERGIQHNLESLSKFLDSFVEWRVHWAKMLTLDTLLANTDRHQDNWGIIIKKLDDGSLEAFFAPAFDNGTALEYSVQEDNFSLYSLKTKLDSHLLNPKRACHHIKWNLNANEKQLNFYELVARFALKYSDTKDIIQECLSFGKQDVYDVLLPLCDLELDEEYRLGRARLDFMIEMVFNRKALLEKAIS